MTQSVLAAIFLLGQPLVSRGTTPTPQPTPEQCSSGQFYSLSTGVCTDCPAGQYHEITGPLTDCTNCAAGQYSAVSGYAECTTCNRGKYSAEGATECTSCAVGTYAASSGKLPDKLDCTLNSHSPCLFLLLTHVRNFLLFSLTGSSACTSCPAGEYNKYTGQSSCVLCPGGKYEPSTGSILCSTCPAVRGYSNLSSAPHYLYKLLPFQTSALQFLTMSSSVNPPFILVPF